MTVKIRRKIIQIDEEKCNGCGACIDSCTEGALALVNGKARLVKEKYCDGLAACLKECPQGALKIIEREADSFDEEAVKEHLQEKDKGLKTIACACPGSAVRQFSAQSELTPASDAADQPSRLSHWPVQLTLVPAGAKFLEGADVVLIADCVPFAYANLHRDFLKDHSVLVACPKLDDARAHLEKLTEVLRKSDIKSITVIRMEVPCCSGLTYITREALTASGKTIPFDEVVIGIRGNIKSRSGQMC